MKIQLPFITDIGGLLMDFYPPYFCSLYKYIFEITSEMVLDKRMGTNLEPETRFNLIGQKIESIQTKVFVGIFACIVLIHSILIFEKFRINICLVAIAIISLLTPLFMKWNSSYNDLRKEQKKIEDEIRNNKIPKEDYFVFRKD